MTTLEMARNDNRVDMKPILRWEYATYSNGKDRIADKDGYRYHVRRSAPRSRAWQAKRNGEYFDKALYPSLEAAIKACEDDAISPKSTLKTRKHEVLVDS